MLWPEQRGTQFLNILLEQLAALLAGAYVLILHAEAVLLIFFRHFLGRLPFLQRGKIGQLIESVAYLEGDVHQSPDVIFFTLLWR